MLIRIALFLALIGTISACSISKKTVKTDKSLQKLMRMMTGSFNSSAQAAQDSSYYNISLQMYPIWQSREGYWLYVEQAVASMPEKPYRQRVYKVERLDKKNFISLVFSIENEEDFIGKWANPKYFEQFDASILKEREGCGVYLNMKNGNLFEGSTRDKECQSSLRGASYATSKVAIRPDRIESWDQGFSDKDEQVWGAVKAGYVFKKK